MTYNDIMSFRSLTSCFLLLSIQKKDVIGIITAVISVTTVQTRIRDGDSLKRSIYIRDTKLASNLIYYLHSCELHFPRFVDLFMYYVS